MELPIRGEESHEVVGKGVLRPNQREQPSRTGEERRVVGWVGWVGGTG